MPITKHGHGEVIPEPGDDQKLAAQQFTEEDRKALIEEQEAADSE